MLDFLITNGDLIVAFTVPVGFLEKPVNMKKLEQFRHLSEDMPKENESFQEE